MLKWLRQKPSETHVRNGGEEAHEVSQNKKIITDDPLATIQVHPPQKKSKNKSEEIYAVSRVNPLFEEEDVPKVVAAGGNQSGSSGYDSGSQTHSETHSDDDEQKFPHRKSDISSTSSTSSFSALSRVPQKHGQLFRDEDDPIHHQSAILSADGKPLLHIVEQNPDFVQSIAVSVGGGRALSPIVEVANGPNKQDVRRSYHISSGAISSQSVNAIAKSTKVSIHPVPTRRECQSQDDDVGVAKIVQKEPRYVQSIVIGSPEGKPGPSTLSKLAQQPLSKKPSVTFSERVELVPNPNRSNGNSNDDQQQSIRIQGKGKVLIKSESQSQSQSPPYRKPSAEQDSIVTESLLLLTSGSGKPQDLNNGNNGNNRLNYHHSSKSGERKVYSSSSSSGGDTGQTQSQKDEDLEAFSSSLRKNRPIKHIHSVSGKSLEIQQAADHYSSSEYLDHHNSHHHHQNDDDDVTSGSDGQGRSYESGSSSNENENENREADGKRRPRGNPKSPFGGIADLYSAAKEIAKEIESYSNGSAKTSSKKSIVRELLSGRGREALTAKRKAFSSGSVPQVPSNRAPMHVFPLSNDAIDEWESVRVQQVYLQGRSWKEIEPNSSTSSSSEDHFGFAGQRVLSVTRQGQVHLIKRDTVANNATATQSFSQPSPSTSSSSSKQHLKGSMYGGSERESSNNEGDDDVSSDSGNSTDRNSKGSSQDHLPEKKSIPPRPKTPAKSPDLNLSSSSEDGNPGSGLSHIDKVMIVTGDSQNMVVDLSGVPLDLREAIVSGAALITLPEGLNKSSVAKKGGYTIISLPSSNNTNNANQNLLKPKSSQSHPETSKQYRTPSDPMDEEMHEIKSVQMSPSELNLRLDQMERGEVLDVFNVYKYGSKNKTHVWDVMQQSVQQTLIEGENGKKKRITTVLPFHPNQDVYKSPDFTMEGQRMERQRKKLDVAKKRRCFCRVFGIFFFLATFIGVLVALSMIYTKGQRYFGSV